MSFCKIIVDLQGVHKYLFLDKAYQTPCIDQNYKYVWITEESKSPNAKAAANYAVTWQPLLHCDVAQLLCSSTTACICWLHLNGIGEAM